MKNVLLLVHDDTGQEARLQAALDLTRRLSGHLHCLNVTPLPVVADPLWGFGSGTVVYDEAEREETNAIKIERRLESEGVPFSFEEVKGEFSECLREASRTADVVVLNRQLNLFPAPDMPNVIANVLADSEALILAVGETCRAFDPAAPALVAWDGSDPAMQTIRRAVPLLTLASSVTIFQAGSLDGDALPAEEAASYLSRHGIKPEIEKSADKADPAGQIRAATLRRNSAYCIMGAFGNSRLKQAIFGGVTRSMLESDGIPLLLGH